MTFALRMLLRFSRARIQSAGQGSGAAYMCLAPDLRDGMRMDE